MSQQDTKTCRGCQRVLPATQEYFYANGSRLRTECKACFKARHAIWRQHNKHRPLTVNSPTKVCKKCQQELPNDTDHFYVTVGHTLSYCKACTNQYGRDWLKSHPEKTRIRRQAYYMKNRDKLLNEQHDRVTTPTGRARMRSYYAANKDRHNANKRRYYQRNRDKYVRWALDRDLRQREAPLDAEANAYLDLIAHDVCCYCGQRAERMHIDHITPLNMGGKSPWDNLTMACRACNCSKGDKPLLTFLLDRTLDARQRNS